MRFNFGSGNSESDVEQHFIAPLLSEPSYLQIPEASIRTKDSLRVHEIDKGTSKKRYVPDYVVWCEGVPVLVIEAKRPDEALEEAYREACLYAQVLNSHYKSGTNPAARVIATNGREFFAGYWDESLPRIKIDVKKIGTRANDVLRLQDFCAWDQLIVGALRVKRELGEREWIVPAEQLGENRVALAKAGHNTLYHELDPVLRRYFDPKDREKEDEIIEKAYVDSDEVTKYERSFEDFLRTRVIPIHDRTSKEISTSRRDANDFTNALRSVASTRSGFMQLVIGGVGSGKTTFIKRYFRHIIPSDLSQSLIYCRVNFNAAPKNLDDVEQWICEQFNEAIIERYSSVLDIQKEEDLRSIFADEIKKRQGGYNFIRKSSEKRYFEKIGTDILDWLADPQKLALSFARALQGDRGITIVVALDNVDRREREDQLKIFQAGQWFMNASHAVCIMTLRDETYETYKGEKPLDAFLKTGNFYIRPPRFADMVSKRLNLAISDLNETSDTENVVDIEGIGRFKYPKSALGNYLSAIYVDLFKKKRRVTLVLEGLSGRDARRSLEMFSAALTSAHFDTSEFTKSVVLLEEYQIREATLLRALMRTNYLYFTSSHGFIRNIYDFPAKAEFRSHFLKYEILRFLVDNRKKQGDVQYEGYFTVKYITELMSSMGFVAADVPIYIDQLVHDELIMTENQTRMEVAESTAVRVRPSGYIHLNILAERTEYLSSCALVTPVSDRKVAHDVGLSWQIGQHRTDATVASKRGAAHTFMDYLRMAAAKHHGGSVGLQAAATVGDGLLRRAASSLNFQWPGQHSASREESGSIDEFDRLFVDDQ